MSLLKKFLSAVIFTFILFGCQHESLILPETEEPTPEMNYKNYIFLGHTYDWQGGSGKVDDRIEALNFEHFDEIWLGGDICASTTREIETLTYLDNLFQISAQTTHWAVGNHDLNTDNTAWIPERTGRPLFYSHYDAGITRIIMNSSIKQENLMNDCKHVQRQLDMIKNVCDTITHSSHLVVMMHYILWLDCEPDMRLNSAENANASWISLKCGPGHQFQHSVYPDLIKVQERGISVIVISGDSGQYGKKYEYIAPSGIQFYMSGINNSFDMNNPTQVERFNTNPDSILIFSHNLETRELIGQFYELNDL